MPNGRRVFGPFIQSRPTLQEATRRVRAGALAERTRQRLQPGGPSIVLPPPSVGVSGKPVVPAHIITPRTMIRRGRGLPAQVFEDLDIKEQFDIRGGDVSPVELRGDAGIFLHTDVQETLDRQLNEIEHHHLELVIAAGNTSGNVQVGFNEDTYILGFSIRTASAAANQDWVALFYRTLASDGVTARDVDIFQSDAASAINPTASGTWIFPNNLTHTPWGYPFFMKGTGGAGGHPRFILSGRSGAGGACTYTCDIVRSFNNSGKGGRIAR